MNYNHWHQLYIGQTHRGHLQSFTTSAEQ